MPDSAHAVTRAVLKTLLYADIFDFSPTPREVHHYLIECRATPERVEAELDALAGAARIERDGCYVALAGRRALFDIRRDRARRSAELWPVAREWGARLAALPFVRMVAVTGALAVNNVSDRADVDFLVATAPGRLWLARALSIGLVRAAASRGVVLCPNYFVTTRRLGFETHNLFTAHDLTQMVPLYGEHVYQALLEENPWWERFLPQARGPVAPPTFYRLPGRVQRLKTWAERALATRVGALLERWERRRKERKFHRQAAGLAVHADLVVFDHDVCKGHFEGHCFRTLEAYQARLRAYGLDGDSQFHDEITGSNGCFSRSPHEGGEAPGRQSVPRESPAV